MTNPPAAIRDGVDQDQGVAAVEQVVGEVHAADPVIGDRNVWSGEVGRHAAHHLGAEAVVTEEDVAEPGYQNSGDQDTSLAVTSGAFSCSAAHPARSGCPPPPPPRLPDSAGT